ncbi:hypothetical protein [Pontibacter sp. H249]|uniref:hypothetical protein n=1 Tax=Pontibacter sp. H249 TaxID=3133420 RepID=UPI0030C3487A
MTIDSVTVQAGAHYKRGPIYRFFWGRRHRDAWTTPIHVPVLDLDTTHGGLTVEKIGGGMQTINATMGAGNGLVYSLRTVDKRPEIKLPALARKTLLADLVRDQTSALHPYAPLVVAPLAKAANVPTPTPWLVYIKPNEEQLGKHKELLSDRLYMLEEKFTDERGLIGDLSEGHDIISTKKMLTNRFTHHNHFIDKTAYSKARLLDLLIGDRDRHEGQWNWAVFKTSGHYLYYPIPKDRDNAFFRFDDGLLSWLLSRKWANRKFKTFDEDFTDIKALMIKSEFLDTRILAGVTAQQYDSIAQLMQKEISDEVIQQAVQKLPPTLYAQQGERLENDLRSRRNELHKAARKFYEVLAKKPLIIGTDKEEIFEVKRLNDNYTEVTVRSATDGNVTFRRTFYRGETHEITLHGLCGNDVFNISGQVKKGLKVIIMPGLGENKIEDNSLVRGQKRNTVVVTSVKTLNKL